MARSRPMWACRSLLVVILAAWTWSCLLPAPATAFAAAAAPNGRNSCGGSSALYTVSADRSGASIWLNHTSGPAGTQLDISGAGWLAGATVTIDAYGNDSRGRSETGQIAIALAAAGLDG